MERLTDKRMNESGAISASPKEYKELAISESLSGEQICKGILDIKGILGDKCDFDRLRELVKADRDGRCVILPCKVGTQLYRIGASICKWREIDHCDEYCDGWQYRDCWEGSAAIVEESFNLQNLESIGKTVFLTREQAEAALNKMKEAESE